MILMTSTLLLVAAFQAYWIGKLYREEQKNLQQTTNVTFQDIMYKVQLIRFTGHPTAMQANLPVNLFAFDLIDSIKRSLVVKMGKPGKTGVIKSDAVKTSISFSFRTDSMHTFSGKPVDTVLPMIQIGSDSTFIRIITSIVNNDKPLQLHDIDTTYKNELLRKGVDIGFTLRKLKAADTLPGKVPHPQKLQTDPVFVGISHEDGFQATFSNPLHYLLLRLKLPILFGLALFGLTLMSFIFMYRNLREQQTLAAIRHGFISNITHELKTPIATVNVAVEALRKFNALDNPERTREYLDISALELQRLSQLVDKVLKLSLYENKEIILNTEVIDLYQLMAEVLASMKLQMDKAGAIASLSSDGDGFLVRADKLHMTGVFVNLLDNALKYSHSKPVINIRFSYDAKGIMITVRDNGIGIPAAYQQKVFENFFRVPSGDRHDVKGYGLGLGYVRHIVERHHGVISVDSKEGQGSTFIIQLPAL